MKKNVMFFSKIAICIIIFNMFINLIAPNYSMAAATTAETYRDKYYNKSEKKWNFEELTEKQLDTMINELQTEYQALQSIDNGSYASIYNEVIGAINTERANRNSKLGKYTTSDGEVINKNDETDVKKAYTESQIGLYVSKFSAEGESQEVKDAWLNTLKENESDNYELMNIINPHVDSMTGEDYDETTPIYHNPSISILDQKDTAEKSIDDMINDGDKFIDNVDSVDLPVDQGTVRNFSKTFYNILLALGVVVAVVMGMIMGIKFMIGGVEEKADIKSMLVPYIIGCVVVFAGFGIWKAVVLILEAV